MTRQEREIRFTELRNETKLAFRTFMNDRTELNMNIYRTAKQNRDSFKKQ